MAEVTWRRRSELARLLRALPADQHEQLAAAARDRPQRKQYAAHTAVHEGEA